MLRMSGFVDDVVFSHNSASGAELTTMLRLVKFGRWWHRGEV